MHTVELLDQALRAAEQLGYRIRHEWLGGSGGGAAIVRGQRWIFLDLATTPQEQLEHVLEALNEEPRLLAMPLSPDLKSAVLRKSA